MENQSLEVHCEKRSLSHPAEYNHQIRIGRYLEIGWSNCVWVSNDWGTHSTADNYHFVLFTVFWHFFFVFYFQGNLVGPSAPVKTFPDGLALPGKNIHNLLQQQHLYPQKIYINFRVKTKKKKELMTLY